MDPSIPTAARPKLAPNLVAAVRRAVGHLLAGGVVIAPTDSSYGIFASTGISKACGRVQQLKGRGPERPFPLVVSGTSDLQQLIPSDAEGLRLSASELRLMHHFWPGPLTLLLAARLDLPREVCSAAGKVGVRIPSHAVAAALCTAVGPLTCTSANRFGGVAALTVSELDPSLLEEDVLVIDDGPCVGNSPSTVLSVGAGGQLEILRAGPITRKQLESVLQP